MNETKIKKVAVGLRLLLRKPFTGLIL